MLNDAHQHRRGRGRLILALLIAGLLAGMPAHAELGWSEADYIREVGPANGSPMTPDQVRFTARNGASVLARFADGQSREELWVVGEPSDGIPAALLAEAQALVKGTPVRRVEFHLAHMPTAEIFEAHASGVIVQVDRRAGRSVRIARCPEPGPCLLLDQGLAMERATDDLMARTEQQLRRQGK